MQRLRTESRYCKNTNATSEALGTSKQKLVALATGLRKHTREADVKKININTRRRTIQDKLSITVE